MQVSPIIGLLGAALLLSACAAKAPVGKAPIDTAKIVDAIKTDEVHWNNDWKSGDAAIVAAHYAPVAVVMRPDVAPMVGAAAIRAGVSRALEDKAFAMTFASDHVDVAASGDLAVARGHYTLTATDPKTKAVVTENGTYVTDYKPRNDGTWKAVWDINTPTAPAAPANAS